MARDVIFVWSAARYPMWSKVDARYFSRMRTGFLALSLMLSLLAACPAGVLWAQNTPPENSSSSSVQAQSAPGSVATPAGEPSATPSTTANDGAKQAGGQPAVTTKDAQASGTSGVLPPAMASKSKLPAESDYNEVHVKPMVKSEDAAKFNPNSIAKAEADVDPNLRTHTKPIRVDVDLVLIPVTITDPMNRLVTGLEKDNFVLLDNGEKQAIQHFSSEDSPISLGVIFDISGSMANKIEKARQAVVEFFKTANPEDEFFLIAFNDKPTLIADFTDSVERVQGQLVYAVPKGRTALLDAIYLGMAKMRQARHQRKALLIISDGGDNRSRYTENEIKSLVKEADVQIYAMGIFDQSARSDEERYGPQLLAEVTDVTGGRTFTVSNPNDMSDVAAKIGVELRNQYVLGYRPTKPARDGKWRKVRVKLNSPKGLPQLSVYSKTGYYAPTE
jgi:Ca-activated chloride channel homolog